MTGGSSGLGRAMALRFAAEGADVVVGDVRAEPREGGRPTADLILEQGGRGTFVQSDASRAADIDRARAHRRGADGAPGRHGPERDRGRAALEGPARDRRGRLGRDHGGRPARRVPLLQARRPADADPGARGRRPRSHRDDLLATRHGRRARPPRLLRREGRRRQPHAPDRGRLRAAGHHLQRRRAGQDPDDADRRTGHARDARLLTRAHAVPAPRSAGGRGLAGRLPRLGRVHVHEWRERARGRRLDGRTRPPRRRGRPAGRRHGGRLP